MLETFAGDLYDYPAYYEVVYGSDCRAELHFLVGCFQRYAQRKVRRVFEPACGTGRLLVRLAKRGYRVSGLDRNPQMAAYCNARLVRHGFRAACVEGDMSDFRLPRPADAAYNMINSFRHLPTEEQAESHLRCMAESVARGGIYVLGLHLTPTAAAPLEAESWSARRGHLGVVTHLWVKDRNLRRRRERCGVTYDIYTPTRAFRLESETTFRTYTAPQFQRLLARVAAWQVAATFDFTYDLAAPIAVTAESEDVVFVLRKRS